MTPSEGTSATVVMPARNAERTIAEQLGALAAQDHTGHWDLLVVDNGSTDSTVAVAMSWADRLPSLRVLPAGSQVGSNHTRNVAMRAASTDIVAFCDADDVVDTGWLRALVAAIAHADAVGGRLEYDLLNDADDLARRPEPPMGGLTGWGGLPAACGRCQLRRPQAGVGGPRRLRRVVSARRNGDRVPVALQLSGYSIAFTADAVVHYRFRRGRRPLFHQYARFGRAQAHLYRDFRDRGMPGPRCTPSPETRRG